MSDEARDSEQRRPPAESGRSGRGSVPVGSSAPTNYPDVGESDELDLRAIWRAVSRNKWLVLAATAICTALAFAFAQTIVPSYSARTKVALGPVLEAATQTRELVSFGGGLTSKRGEVAAIRSPATLRAVAEAHELGKTPEYNPALREPGLTAQLRHAGAALGSGLGAARSALADGQLGRAWERLGDAAQEALAGAPRGQATSAPGPPLNVLAKRLEKRLSTSLSSDSPIVTIRVRSRDSERAARLANSIAETYLRRRYTAIRDRLNQALTQTEGRIGTLASKLSELGRKVERLRNRRQSPGSRAGGVIGQKIASLNSELIRLRAKRQKLKSRLDQLRTQIEREGSVLAAARRIEAPTLQRLRQNERDLLQQRSELATRYGKKHPRMKNLAARLESVRGQMREAVKDILNQRDDRLQLLRQREKKLQARLNAAVEKARPDADLAVALRRSERELAATKRQLEELRKRRDKLQATLTGLERTGGTAAFITDQVLEKAEPPGSPTNMQTPGLVTMGSVAGVMLGLGLVLLVELLDMGVRTPEQLERLTGLPVIGMVPMMRKKGRYAASREVIDSPTSPFAETVSSVLIALTAGRRPSRARAVSVTSALPFEGKSALAIAMARVAARTGQRVMLVDADLRRPSVHRHLGIDNTAHLATLLEGEGGVEDVIQRDPESPLFVIPGTVYRGNPLDLVSGDDFYGLIEALRDYVDLIVVDTPPLLAVADSRSIMRQVDQTLYVVRWGKTHRDAVLAAARTFLYTQPDTVSVVLNQVDPKKFAKYRESASHQYARYLAEAYPPG